MDTRTVQLQYSADENPPHWLSLGLAAQHVLFMLSGVLFIPILLAKTGRASLEEVEYLAFVSILVSGVTSLIQVVRIGVVGSGYVLFMGTSGAFIACTLAAVDQGGLALAASLAMLSAPFEFLISYFFRFLRKIFTPAVGGVVIMLVSVTIIPITLGLWVGEEGSPGAGSRANLLIGLATFLTMLGCAVFGSKKLRQWGPLLGIGSGYVTAALFGQLEMTNLNAAGWFGLPRADWPGIEMRFQAAHWPIFIAFLIATVAGTIETVGDVIAVQKVSKRNFRKVDYDSVQGALYADGVGNFLAGLAGTTPNTTYSSNISLLELSGVASRRVGLYGAILLGLLAFFPKVSGFILDIPGPALGAATFVLIGMLFVTGLRVATMEGVTPQTAMIISIAFWGGYAAGNELFFTDLIPGAVRPLVSNAIATGSAIALLIAVIFQLKPVRRTKETLRADLTDLPKLQGFVDRTTERFQFDDPLQHDLQLCCEEIFVCLCEADAEEGFERTVAVRCTLEEDAMLVEITDRSSVEDVDLPRLPDDVGAASLEELRHLGLVLVSKLAHDVNHLKISGRNYISFRLPRSARSAKS